MIEGVDLGNYNTKSGSGVIFASKICKRLEVLNQRSKDDKSIIEYKGKRYIIGEGELQTESNKLDKEMYTLCLLTVLARSSADNSFKIVIGIPGNQYNDENINKLKNELLADKIHHIKSGTEERTIIIEDVAACPETVGAYYGIIPEQRAELKHNDLIMVNIGGGNTNISYFKQKREGRKLERSSTLVSGTIQMFSDIVNLVNGVHSTNYNTEDAESILKYGINVFGAKQDMLFIHDIIVEHTDRIFKELNMYPIKTSKVMFTGGGSKTLKSILKQRLPGCMFQTNYLIAGAVGFRKVGERLWPNE